MEIDSLEIEWAVTSKGRKEKENEFGSSSSRISHLEMNSPLVLSLSRQLPCSQNRIRLVHSMLKTIFNTIEKFQNVQFHVFFLLLIFTNEV